MGLKHFRFKSMGFYSPCSGCPLETLIWHHRSRRLSKTPPTLDDDAADQLEKTVHPYRPPGISWPPDVTMKFMEDPESPIVGSSASATASLGMDSLVHPVEVFSEEDGLDVFDHSIPRTGPYFDLLKTRNVTALKGVTAYLICRVRRLGNHTVRKKTQSKSFPHFHDKR